MRICIHIHICTYLNVDGVKLSVLTFVCVSVNSSYLIALTTFNKAKANVALPPFRIEAPSNECEQTYVAFLC